MRKSDEESDRDGQTLVRRLCLRIEHLRNNVLAENWGERGDG